MRLTKVTKNLWVPFQILAGASLSVVLGWLVIRGIHWDSVVDNISDFPLHLFFIALLVFLIGTLFRTWRWHVLFVHEHISFSRLFFVQNAGIGLNNLSPIRVVSEPLQLALITRRGGVSTATGLATLSTEHLMDVFVTAGLLTLGVFLLPELRDFSIPLVGAIALSIVSLLIFLLIVGGINLIPGSNKVPLLGRTLTAINTLRSSPGRLLLSLIGTLIHWALTTASGAIIASGLGLDINATVVVVLCMGSVFFVSAVPSLPGGALTFEAAVVYTLSLFGITGETSLVFALILHLIMFGPSTVIAIFVLPREGVKMFGRRSEIIPPE